MPIMPTFVYFEKTRVRNYIWCDILQLLSVKNWKKVESLCIAFVQFENISFQSKIFAFYIKVH